MSASPDIVRATNFIELRRSVAGQSIHTIVMEVRETLRDGFVLLSMSTGGRALPDSGAPSVWEPARGSYSACVSRALAILDALHLRGFARLAPRVLETSPIDGARFVSFEEMQAARHEPIRAWERNALFG
ncbi:hypothetical protein E4T66_17540 [Sinimarinibacterium sp. CAU 1509]|uniref:hypothetical protein n=1 Tax=Sinimarinibacterium sp. CAU 1509 TaxID=2562283 RepID=UPI0010AD4D76|nr:hypothetical protein [Sinimarinibacterium sp. CAU 1509]TJY57212.1 hypothetical protein E4T66_17540 [Sinimarinibacterium sp. CAU 1509]